jgi:hypothetical protein
MRQIVGFDQLDRHQKALTGLARDARVSAQLKIGTPAGFDQGQSHPPAALQAWNFGGLKMGAGWGWHHAPSIMGGSVILSLTDGSRDRAAIHKRYTLYSPPDTIQFEARPRRNKKPGSAGLFCRSRNRIGT